MKIDLSKYNLDDVMTMVVDDILSDLEISGIIKFITKRKKVKPIKTSSIDEVIDYYNSKMNTNFKGDMILRKNIATVLRSYTIQDCITIIDFITTDSWYIDNNLATLSVIFRPTKFAEKLERAKLVSLKPSDYNENNNTFQGLEIL